MNNTGDAKMRFEMALSFMDGDCASKVLANAWLRKAYSVSRLDDVVYFANRVAELYASGKSVVEPWVRECVDKLYWQLEKDSAGCAMAALMALANSNCAWAIYRVGGVYDDGMGGMDANASKAFKMYVKAAELGLPDALKKVGFFYAGVTKGVDVDEEKAKEYFSRAFNAHLNRAEKGDTYSQRMLGYAYEDGSRLVNNKEDRQLAFEWFLKAAISGDSAAMENVADCYCDGEGVSQDSAKALEWYEKAAENGAQNAQSDLAYNYYRGGRVMGVELETDYEKSFRFAKMAVEQHDDKTALRILAQCYYHGRGVSENNDEAFEYFKRAAEKGEELAMDYLADCYYHGFGTNEDKAKAKEWYEKAAAEGVESAKESLKKLEEESSGGW